MMNSRPTKRPEAPRGPFKELRRTVTRLLNSKGFLMALSLLIAVLAWGALVASDGTLTRHKIFVGVPVNVTGEASLKAQGYIVMDDIRKLVPSARMTVEVSQQNYNRATISSYNPHFDLTDVTGSGENELKIEFSSQLYGPVVSCEPSSVKVNVERYMTRRVPVVVELVGEIAEGAYLDSYRIDPTTLSVSGPQSLVTQVSRAVAQLNVSALSIDRPSDRTSLTVNLQNASGDVMASDKLEVTNQTVITDSVVVDTELVPAQMVPLMTGELVAGTPAQGYELVGVDVSERELLVAAKTEVLRAIEFLTTDQPLNIEGATENVSGYVRIKRPGSIENTLPAEVAVTAVIGEKSTERTLRNVPIEIDGVDAAMKATLKTTRATVQLVGAYGFIHALQPDDVRLFVDVSGLEAGEHVLPVQISIDNAQEFSCALSTPEVSVVLSAP